MKLFSNISKKPEKGIGQNYAVGADLTGDAGLRLTMGFPSWTWNQFFMTTENFG